MDKRYCPFEFYRSCGDMPCNCSLRCAILEGRKPRVRVEASTRMLGSGVPDDARPGDLVVGNRGAAAFVIQPASQFGGLCACLTLEYAGNYHDGGIAMHLDNKVYDFR